jgi:hypothetical protein
VNNKNKKWKIDEQNKYEDLINDNKRVKLENL